MFFTEPVHRLRHIELEHLMDPELIKKLITGITSEINAPLTVYSANVIESFISEKIAGLDGNHPEACWMPIEAYSTKQELIPDKYNQFCSTCRQSVIQFIRRKKIGPENCGYWDNSTNTCSGRKPVCKTIDGEQIDWNHCPRFIDERKEYCPCYNADTKFIKETVRKNWKNKQLDDLCERSKCIAGFHEAAFPIIIHDHLVGVAMTGQVFFSVDDLPDVREFINKSRIKVHPDIRSLSWEALKGHETELKKMKYVLLWKQEQLRKKVGFQLNRGELPIFYYDNENQYREHLKRLKKSIDKIEEVASIRYRDIRTRSEIAFCEEIVGYIRHAIRKGFPESTIPKMLNRMRDFWAFEFTALLSQPKVPNNHSEEKKTKLIAFSPEEQLKVNLPYYLSTEIDQIYEKDHPTSWCYDPINISMPSDKWTEKLFTIVVEEVKRDVIRDSTSISQKDMCYLLIIIPFGDNVYSFCFSLRDTEKISLTERLYEQVISQLCREFILSTCTQVIHELGSILSK